MSRTVRQSTYASVAQKAINADSASRANTAISASYAVTASVLLGGAPSSSFAISASYAATSSYSRTLGASLDNDGTGLLKLVSSAGTSISSISQLTASLANTASLARTSSYALTASYALSAIRAVSASYIDTLSQNVIITGSVAIGTNSIGNGENNILLGPAPAGGTGEGGQLGLLAKGDTYTSSSFIDTWQDQFRILRGPGAVSNAGLMYMNLQTGNTQFVGAVTASAYSGLPNDYLYVTRNTDQTIVSGTWANRDIIFNNKVVEKGITYDTGTGLASLTGGKVYRITARLAWIAGGVYLLQFSCYNSSNIILGPTVEMVQASNTTNNISDATLDFIYAPGSNVNIKIRTTSGTNGLTGEYIRGDLNTQLIIQQIA